MGDIKKLEFYLDFDKWTVNDLNDFNKGYDDIAIMYTVTSFELYRKMVKKYPHIEITPINTREINTNCCCPAYGIATHVIKNPESKKFMVISWCDKAYYIGKGNLEKSHPLYERYKDSWGWDLDNCVNIFQPEGVHYDDLKYKKLIPHDCYDNEGYRKDCVEFEYTPCTITTHFKSGHDQIEISYKNEDRISARTIDGMGLGCAVIRPELVIEYHNKLIPNYHYAKVECDDLSDFKKLSDAYIDKFEELKNNPKLVEFYSQNGRKWYEENCTLDSYVRIYLDELIDLEKLK